MKLKKKNKTQEEEWKNFTEYLCKQCKKWYKFKNYNIHEQRCNNCKK